MSDWGYKHKSYDVVSYDDIDITDRAALMKARESTLREQWVKVAEQRLVREELSKCYRAEGVNHYKNCKHLAEFYLNMLKENKHVTGYAFQERADPNA
ncbi:hypothetical protein PYCC9005_002027 [Savitreella phatthalungensis]